MINHDLYYNTVTEPEETLGDGENLTYRDTCEKNKEKFAQGDCNYRFFVI